MCRRQKAGLCKCRQRHSGAFDAAGNVYLANDEHHVIQKLAPNGMVSVVTRPH